MWHIGYNLPRAIANLSTIVLLLPTYQVECLFLNFLMFVCRKYMIKGQKYRRTLRYLREDTTDHYLHLFRFYFRTKTTSQLSEGAFRSESRRHFYTFV